MRASLRSQSPTRFGDCSTEEHRLADISCVLSLCNGARFRVVSLTRSMTGEIERGVCFNESAIQELRRELDGIEPGEPHRISDSQQVLHPVLRNESTLRAS